MQPAALGSRIAGCLLLFLFMKMLLILASGLALVALSTAAVAQTTPPPAPGPRQAAPITNTTDRRAATYKGPRVVKDTKSLGTKFIRNSKPAPETTHPAKQ